MGVMIDISYKCVYGSYVFSFLGVPSKFYDSSGDELIDLNVNQIKKVQYFSHSISIAK